MHQTSDRIAASHCTGTHFFPFFLYLLQGFRRSTGKEFGIKIPHDEGAQDIFISNSEAVLEWRQAVPYLCIRKEGKLSVVSTSPFRLTAARAAAWLKAQRSAAARQALPPQQHYFTVIKEHSSSIRVYRLLSLSFPRAASFAFRSYPTGAKKAALRQLNEGSAAKEVS